MRTSASTNVQHKQVLNMLDDLLVELYCRTVSNFADVFDLNEYVLM